MGRSVAGTGGLAPGTWGPHLSEPGFTSLSDRSSPTLSATSGLACCTSGRPVPSCLHRHPSVPTMGSHRTPYSQGDQPTSPGDGTGKGKQREPWGHNAQRLEGELWLRDLFPGLYLV